MMTREHPHMIKRAYSIHFMIGAKTYRMSKTQKDQVSLPYYEYSSTINLSGTILVFVFM